MAAIEMTFIRIKQRQAPQRIIGRVAGSQNAVGGRILFAEKGWQFGAKRDPRRTCQRGKVNHEIGRILERQAERIGKNKPSFSIGVADLNRNIGGNDQGADRAR